MKNNIELDKELFNKLPQLDRIEYRQKLENIKDTFSGNLFINLSEKLLALALFVVFFNIIVYKIDGTLIYSVGFIGIFVVIGVYCWIIGIAEMCFKIYKRKKYCKELNEEYFTLKISK